MANLKKVDLNGMKIKTQAINNIKKYYSCIDYHEYDYLCKRPFVDTFTSKGLYVNKDTGEVCLLVKMEYNKDDGYYYLNISNSGEQMCIIKYMNPYTYGFCDENLRQGE